jgi:Protein of unknown function (DUF1236)
MWPSLRHDAVTYTLAACVALAAAAVQVGRGSGGGSTDASAMDETTGSVSRPHGAGLALSDEQRERIYESVMVLSGAPVARAPAPALADALPRGVPMQDLPAGVTREIPAVLGHKFVKFDDRIVVVDPASRLVVAMIPRYKLLP